MLLQDLMILSPRSRGNIPAHGPACLHSSLIKILKVMSLVRAPEQDMQDIAWAGEVEWWGGAEGGEVLSWRGGWVVEWFRRW